jgi:hypothetical protein
MLLGKSFTVHLVNGLQSLQAQCAELDWFAGVDTARTYNLSGRTVSSALAVAVSLPVAVSVPDREHALQSTCLDPELCVRIAGKRQLVPCTGLWGSLLLMLINTGKWEVTPKSSA